MPEARNETFILTHKSRASLPVQKAEAYSIALGFLTVHVFVSLLLTETFRVRVQLRE